MGFIAMINKTKNVIRNNSNDMMCSLTFVLPFLALLSCMFSHDLNKTAQTSLLLLFTLGQFLCCYFLARRDKQKQYISRIHKKLLSFKENNGDLLFTNGSIYFELNEKLQVVLVEHNKDISLSSGLIHGKKVNDFLFNTNVNILTWLSELEYGLFKKLPHCFLLLNQETHFKAELIACKECSNSGEKIGLLVLVYQDADSTATQLPGKDEIESKENICAQIENLLSKVSFDTTIVVVSHVSLRNISLISEIYGRYIINFLIDTLYSKLYAIIAKDDFVMKVDRESVIFSLKLERADSNSTEQIQQKILAVFQDIQQKIGNDISYIKPVICAGCIIVNSKLTPGALIFDHAQIAFSKTYSLDKENIIFGNDVLYKQHEERITMLAMLTEAINDNQFSVYYQPKYSFKNSAVSGVEALIRWYHPNYGFIPPDRFIPVAEKSELIHFITSWVISTVFCFAAEIDNITFSINLSGKDFDNPQLLQHIDKMAFIYEVDTSRIIFEITETVMISNPDLALKTLTTLKQKGYGIHIEDFGIGYSSLNYLREFPFDAIKLDRSFIIGITSNERDLSIVKSIVSLAKAFSLSVVAEGVESKEQFDLIDSMGCEEFQGYLYSKPLSRDDLIEFLSNKKIGL